MKISATDRTEFSSQPCYKKSAVEKEKVFDINDVSANLSCYKDFCSKFSDITFRLGDFEKAMSDMNEIVIGYNDSTNQIGNGFSEIGQLSIEIDVSVIKKIRENPDYELEGIVKGIKQTYRSKLEEGAREGFPYIGYEIFIEDNEIRYSCTSAKSRFSTEEELRAIKNGTYKNTRLEKMIENKKNENLDYFLDMLDGSWKKRKVKYGVEKAEQEEKLVEEIQKREDTGLK